ncbi:MAG: hypothetical protein ACPG8W_19220 [Candidatus Promineifilaceae bacterium]
MVINQLEDGWRITKSLNVRLDEQGHSLEIFCGKMPDLPQEVGKQVRSLYQIPYPYSTLPEQDKSADTPVAIGRCSLSRGRREWLIRIAKWAGTRFEYHRQVDNDAEDEVLGTAIIETLQRSAAKPKYYKNPDGDQPLAAEVLRQLDRLEIPYQLKMHLPKQAKVAYGFYEIPLALQQLSKDVHWRAVKQLYDTSCDNYSQDPSMHDAYDNNQADNPPYALYELFYSHDVQYYWMCRLDAENPSNPWVYNLDHDGSDWEQELTELGKPEKPSWCRLSDLLANLQREPEEEL